ncbi:MAG: TolB family protein, partial [Anaerolineae bacterium]
MIAAGAVACGLLASALSPARVVYDVFPVWSPEGQAIAFVCYRPFLEITIDLAQLFEPTGSYIDDKRHYAEICSTAPDGSNRRQLTHNRAADYHPVWSPDGAQIAFVSERDGN